MFTRGRVLVLSAVVGCVAGFAWAREAGVPAWLARLDPAAVGAAATLLALAALSSGSRSGERSRAGDPSRDAGEGARVTPIPTRTAGVSPRGEASSPAASARKAAGRKR